MSNRRKTRKLAPWIAMDRHQYKSAAFAALSAVAQALLVHLTYSYNTKMMNSVWMSARDGAKKLNVGRNTVARALLELEHYGFIVKIRGAYLGVSGVGTSAHYRLTAQSYGNIGATRDYEKWNGEIFTLKENASVSAEGNLSTRQGGAKPWKAEGVSRATWYRRQTVRQNPVPPQSQCVPPQSHTVSSRNRPKMEPPSHHRAIESRETRPTTEPYLVLPASGRKAVPNGPPNLPAALMEWSKPILPYTPELRRLYCDYCEVMGEPEDAAADGEWSTPVLVGVLGERLKRGELK
jgi:predicted transcriptional regulator